jgi:Protein of unknown function (DUF1559)
MAFPRTHLAALAILMTALPATAQDADPLRHLAPYLGEDAVVVGRFDLRNLDVEQVRARLRKMGVDASGVEAFGAQVGKVRQRLLAAGAKHIYFTNAGMLPEPDLLFVIPSDDAQAAAAAIPAEGLMKARVVGKVVLVGSPKGLEGAGKQLGTPSPEWAKLLPKLEAYPSYAALLPPATLKRVLIELQPNLPAELGGGPMQPLLDGIRWGAIGFDLSAKPSVEFSLQTKDEAAAKQIEAVLERGIALLKKTELRDLSLVVKLLDEHRPKRVGDRLVASLDAAAIDSTLVPVAATMREKAATTQSMNNLRQIALAMHIYHDANKTFPPQGTADKKDRPLLSWRVHILPYIEQKGLYDQFRLDEPWDSEHNKKLIAKMPTIYRSALSKTKLEDGLTTYVVPAGPNAFFNGKKTRNIRDITDGTSNTIMAFDVDESKAVTWTRPDDYPVAPKMKFAGVFRPAVGKILAAFFDGSVRQLSARTPDETLWLYVCPNDGTPIPPEKE